MGSSMGVFYLLLASLLWASGNITISLICPAYIDVTKVNFYIFFFWSLMSLPFYRTGKIQNLKQFLLQHVLNTAYQSFATIAYAFANPNDCIAIISMSIFATPVLSYLMINQRFNVKVLVSILLYSFVGVLLLIQPPFLNPLHEITGRNMIGYGMAIIVIIARSTLIVLQSAHAEDSTSLTMWAGVSLSGISLVPMIEEGFQVSP